MRVRLGLPRSKNQWTLALLGTAVAVGSAIALVQGILSLDWPKVDGVIAYSRDKAGQRVRGVDVGYTYSAGGQDRTGTRYRFQFVLSARTMPGGNVQLTLGRYEQGQPIKIAVNPADPADSVLEPGPDPESVLPLLLGLFLMFLGLADVSKPESV